MLKYLYISNYALIDRLEINFESGFTTITGETGAGKSIILGALMLILGKRADTTVLQNKDQKCVIEGKFDISKTDNKVFFQQNDLDYEDITIIRREISPSGKSRAFINDTPVNLNQLKELTSTLIDIHSQHQNIQLNQTAFQLSLIDGFSKNGQLLETYKNTYKNFKKSGSKLENLKELRARQQKDQDYYNFQFNEINDADFSPDETKILEDDLNTLGNAEKIQEILSKLEYLLYENERSIYNLLNEVKKEMENISSLNTTIESIRQRLESLSIEIKDIYDESNNFSSSVSTDDKRLEEVNSRLLLLQKLLNKHQVNDVIELNQVRDQFDSYLQNIDTAENEINDLENEVQELNGKLSELAKELTDIRKEQIPYVEKEVIILLQSLGMPNARFSIKHQILENFNEFGKDQFEWLFSANKGSELSPVSSVASGGEISRLILSIKYLQTGTNVLPTIIFDEIDTGISGEIAIKTAHILKKLSLKHQVLSITHLPQIAASGDQQYIVYKDAGGPVTYTRIKPLHPDERTLEIAKMLSGDNAGEAALNTAKEMLRSG